MKHYYLLFALLFVTVVPLSYVIIFACAPKLILLFLHFPALTGKGVTCHILLVTGCVMDGILVKALFCLRHAAGWRQPSTPAIRSPIPHSTCHTPQPAHITLHYKGFSFPHLPRFNGTLLRFFRLLAFNSPLLLFVFLLHICWLQMVHHELMCCFVSPSEFEFVFCIGTR